MNMEWVNVNKTLDNNNQKAPKTEEEKEKGVSDARFLRARALIALMLMPSYF